MRAAGGASLSAAAGEAGHNPAHVPEALNNAGHRVVGIDLVFQIDVSGILDVDDEHPPTSTVQQGSAKRTSNAFINI